MSKTVLALVPHPDDAEFYAGGTLAKMISEGDRVYVVVATDGRCGSFTMDHESLAAIRADEMRRAAAVLGAEPPILLGYPDMGLDQLPPGTLREKFIRAIRQIKPDVVFTEDPYAPFETHPDHRAVAWAATEAISYARLPLICSEHLAEGLLPHLVVEKYFYTDTPTPASKIIDITGTIGCKIAALAAHRSQVEFLVEGVLMEARLAGLDLRAIFGAAADDPAALLAWGVQATAAEIGQQIGVQYAEAFRYERFGALVEGMLGNAKRKM
ncbi:MAG: PIG-L family deacetylase [Chloroflexi bacterium]|nr:PIG-L family deacetylase [Chloroflexota bacterium]